MFFVVVLDHEDLLACHGYAGRAGRVNTNVLPLPSSLSTQIRPPCSSTRRFDSASPRPVPSRLLLARVGLLELLEDPVLVLRGDARSGVA